MAQYGGYNQMGYGSNPYDQRDDGPGGPGGNRYNNYSQGNQGNYNQGGYSQQGPFDDRMCHMDLLIWT